MAHSKPEASTPSSPVSGTRFFPGPELLLVAGLALALAWAVGYFEPEDEYLRVRAFEQELFGPAVLPTLARLLFAPLLLFGDVDALTTSRGTPAAVAAYSLLYGWTLLWARHRLAVAWTKIPGRGWTVAAVMAAADIASAKAIGGSDWLGPFLALIVVEGHVAIAIAVLVTIRRRLFLFLANDADRGEFAAPNATGLDSSAHDDAQSLRRSRRLVGVLLLLAIGLGCALYARSVPRLVAAAPDVHLLRHSYWMLDGRRLRSPADRDPERGSRELYAGGVFLGHAEWVSISPTGRFVAWQELGPVRARTSTRRRAGGSRPCSFYRWRSFLTRRRPLKVSFGGCSSSATRLRSRARSCARGTLCSMDSCAACPGAAGR